jgi:hypothetical protein
MRSVAVTNNTPTASAGRTVASRSGGTGRTTATRTTAQRSFSKGASEGRAKPGKTETTAGRAGKGFDAMKRTVTQTKGENKEYNDFKVDYDAKYVIAFLEPENYAAIARHWVNITTKDGGTSRTPRNCLRDLEADADDNVCPLCQIGHNADPLALFNVVDLENPTKVLRWEASPGIFDKIVELAEELASIPEKNGGPLELNSPGVFAVVSKKKTGTGKRGFTEYTIKRVKERDLAEDYDLESPSEEDFDTLADNLYTVDDIKFNTVEELDEFVAGLED